MSISSQPPMLEHRAGTLAEKLYKRIDWQPEKQPLGFVCTDFEDMRKGAGIGASLFSGIFMLLIGGLIANTGISGISSISAANILGGIIAVIFLLSGFMIVLGGITHIWSMFDKLQALKRAAPGELILKSYPLRLGETMTLTFRRHLKSGYQVKTQGKVWGRLVCLEVYMDNRGSGSASYYGESVWYQDLSAFELSPGVSRIEQDWYIRIPFDGTPTIKIKNSSEFYGVFWCIDVWLDIPGVIKDDSVFHLFVEPEVVRSWTLLYLIQLWN